MLVRGLDGDDGVGEDGEGTFGMLAKYFAETEAVSEEVTGDKTEEKPSVVNSEQVGWLDRNKYRVVRKFNSMGDQFYVMFSIK